MKYTELILIQSDYFEPWLLRELWEPFIYDTLTCISFHFHNSKGRDSIAWFLVFGWLVFGKHIDRWKEILNFFILSFNTFIGIQLIRIIKFIICDIIISLSYVGLKFMFGK